MILKGELKEEISADCSRLDLLEGQMTNVNDKLDGISSLLSRLASHLPGQMQSPNPQHPPLEVGARTSSSELKSQTISSYA